MRRSGTGSTWLGIVAAGAAVALLGAACGGTAADGAVWAAAFAAVIALAFASMPIYFFIAGGAK